MFQMLISPAKKMQTEDFLSPQSNPLFLEKTQQLLEYLKQQGKEGCQTIWNCNESLTTLNWNRLCYCQLDKNLSPALFCYQGLQYQSLAANCLTEQQLSYLQNHLWIVSGFYGLLRPMDGVVCYRLEMQSKLPNFLVNTLYQFWADSLAEYFVQNYATQPIINLASQEYSKAIQKYLPKNFAWIDCSFKRNVKGKFVEQATFAKIARGAMVAFLAEKQATSISELKEFSAFGFEFSQAHSTDTHFVFIQKNV